MVKYLNHNYLEQTHKYDIISFVEELHCLALGNLLA